MLSKDAFRVAFVLSIDAMSLHDLRKTMIFEGIKDEQRDKQLYEGLVNLCRFGLLSWSFEPDYGNQPAIKPPDCGVENFLKFWHEFIKKSDLSIECPDSQNPTIFLEGTPALNREVDKDCYDEWRQEIKW